MMLRKLRRPAFTCAPHTHSCRTSATCAYVGFGEPSNIEYGLQSEGGFLSSAPFDVPGGRELLWRDWLSDIVQWCNRTFPMGVSRKASTVGNQICALISESGLTSSVFVGNNLLKIYVKCGSVTGARQVFDKMPEHDVVSWTTMISAYVQYGNCEEAINLFRQMQEDRVKPNIVTFTCALKACAGLKSLDQAKEVHASIIDRGLESDVFIGSTLVDMYSKCGSILDAVQVFKRLPARNVVSWTAMISGYVQHRLGDAALKLFQQMQLEKVVPNEVTFASALNACGLVASLEQGKGIHKDIVKHGFESDIFLGNTLIEMYVNCGSIEGARQAFDKMPKHDIVSWNSMLAGYVHHRHNEQALIFFWQMLAEAVTPDKATFISSVKACANLGCLEQGEQIYSQICKSKLDLDVVLGSALVDMYAKCGSIDNARLLFNLLPERDVVTWTAMISACFRHGHAEEALKLYLDMRLHKVVPDKLTFVNVLNACARISALEQGKRAHSDVIASGLQEDVCIGSSLVDMYAKCGSLKEAQDAFDVLCGRDAVAWNALIAGYAQHGDSRGTLHLFEQMCRDGIKMDNVTFLNVLSACSRGGLVDEGRRLFDSMAQDHGLKPAAEHYSCMVDILSRAGHLAEAEEFIKKMPFQPNATVWTSLLGASRTYGNIVIANRAVHRVHELEPRNAASSVLLANTFNGTGRFDDKAKVRALMESRGLRKEPGWSRIEIHGQVYTFLVDDMSHPQSKEIRVELQKMLKEMKEAGYEADLRCVLRDIPEDQKENALLHHSERLAMALGHMSLPPRAPLRVIKNLRVCADCHTATKFMCKLMKREIIVRDATRFHHFKNGICSCGDYW